MKRLLKFSSFVLLAGLLFNLSCQKKILCPDCDTNKHPIANAGVDQIITLPKDSTILDGTSSSDADGTITSYKWIKISGPVSSNTSNPNSSKTLVKSLTMGVYNFELTVTDNGGLSSKDTMQLIINNPAINQPPIANAGNDQTLILPNDSTTLNGTLSFDPDGTIASYQWTKISGPLSYTIITPNTSQTKVKSLIQGVYQFELTVTDNGRLVAKDTIKIMVDNPAVNQLPIACAGADHVITLPTNTVTLDGSCSVDPDNNITGYLWTKISGPSTFNIANSNLVQTQVTNLVQGTYQFELKVTDAGGLFSMDTMKVLVDTVAIASCPPFNRSIINAQLIPFGTLSEARGRLSIASSGNKIVFAGGQNASNVSATVDIYDLSSQIWSTAQLSVARFGMAAIGAGNKIYFAGGYTATAFTTTTRVDIYDMISNTWSTAELSEPRAGIAYAVVGNKILFAGGDSYNASGTANTVTNKVDIYDIAFNTWSTATLSMARTAITATTVGNKIYFAGGGVPCHGSFDRIDIYDNVTNTWSTSTLSEPKFDMGSFVAGNNIYWAGGITVYDCFNDTYASCKVEKRNLSDGTITTNHLFQPGVNKALLKNNFVVFYSGLMQFDIYDKPTRSWSIGVMNLKFYNAGVISVDNNIYIAGDGHPNAISNKVWKLDF